MTAVSCATEIVGQEKETVSDELLCPVDMTFNVDIDNTKTVLGDAGKCSFENGDQIKILCLDATETVKSTVAAVTVEDGVATISATVEDSNNYYAVYPANVSVALAKDGTLTVTDPVSQKGTFADASICVARTAKSEPSFSFKHAVGMLKFSIERTDVASVDIVAKGGANLAGDLVCTFTQDGVTIAGGSEPSINAKVSGAGTYYVAIAPGAEAPALAIRMNISGELVPAVNVVPAEPIVFERAAISNVGRIDNRVITDYYISGSGEGNGLSAATPAGFSLLSTLASNDIYSNYVIAGTSFHILEGTHTVKTILDLNPVTASPFTIQGEGNVTLNQNSNINFVKTQGAADVTLKNIKFSSFKGYQGGVLYMNGGRIFAQNCIFSSNTDRIGSSGAGVIRATGNSDATFTNCEFLSNTCTGSSDSPSVAMLFGNAFMKFNGCYFGSNTATNRAVINAQGTSVVFLNACSFNNNKNTAAATYASVIHAAGNGVCVNSCTFYQNNGKADGKPLNNTECITASANMIITNSTFYEYFQQNRSVIAGIAAKKGIIFNDVVLNNYSGSVFYFSSAGYKFTSCGHNIYRTVTDYRADDAKIGIPAATGDVSGVAVNILSGGKWDNTLRCYTWDGTFSSGSLTKAAASEFETAVKAMTESVSNTVTGSGKLGDLFWNWLISINAADKDQLGTSRGTTDWWPGSYQKP